MAAEHSTWQMLLVMPRILLAVAAAVGVACDRGAATDTTGTTDGAALYAAMCASCHGASGKPPESMVAQMNVRDLTAPELRARITPALVEKQIRSGSPNRLMPSFAGALTDEQIRAIAAFVASPELLAD